MKLLDAAGNSTGAWFEVPEPGNKHHTHVRTIFTGGDLDGGTVTIEGSHQTIGTTPTARQIGTVTTITALGLVNISARLRQIRAVLAGGGGSVDVDVTVV